MTVRNKSDIGKGVKRGVKMIHAPILTTFPDIFLRFFTARLNMPLHAAVRHKNRTAINGNNTKRRALSPRGTGYAPGVEEGYSPARYLAPLLRRYMSMPEEDDIALPLTGVIEQTVAPALDAEEVTMADKDFLPLKGYFLRSLRNSVEADMREITVSADKIFCRRGAVRRLLKIAEPVADEEYHISILMQIGRAHV